MLHTEQDITEFTGNDRFLCDRSPCRGMLGPECEVEMMSPKVTCAGVAREMRGRCARVARELRGNQGHAAHLGFAMHTDVRRHAPDRREQWTPERTDRIHFPVSVRPQETSFRAFLGHTGWISDEDRAS